MSSYNKQYDVHATQRAHPIIYADNLLNDYFLNIFPILHQKYPLRVGNQHSILSNLKFLRSLYCVLGIEYPSQHRLQKRRSYPYVFLHVVSSNNGKSFGSLFFLPVIFYECCSSCMVSFIIFRISFIVILVFILC